MHSGELPATNDMHRPSRRAFVIAAASLIATGCASTRPPPSPPTMQRLTVRVATDVNPDARGRPSPIVVRAFLLSAVDAFGVADFFGLVDREREAIGGDLLGVAEAILGPGEARVLQFERSPRARFVGVIAGYRDIERAVWRGFAPLPSDAADLPVAIERSRVAITSPAKAGDASTS